MHGGKPGFEDRWGSVRTQHVVGRWSAADDDWSKLPTATWQRSAATGRVALRPWHDTDPERAFVYAHQWVQREADL